MSDSSPSSDDPLTLELQAWFEQYRQAFLKGARSTATCYHEPCVTARGDIARCHVDRDQIEAFWQGVIDGYASRGYADGHIVSLRASSMGANARAADVTWSYVDAADKELWRWSQCCPARQSFGSRVLATCRRLLIRR